MVKNMPAVQENHVRSLNWEDFLEKEMAFEIIKTKENRHLFQKLHIPVENGTQTNSIQGEP